MISQSPAPTFTRTASLMARPNPNTSSSFDTRAAQLSFFPRDVDHLEDAQRRQP
jgi:hypothetical protein